MCYLVVLFAIDFSWNQIFHTKVYYTTNFSCGLVVEIVPPSQTFPHTFVFFSQPDLLTNCMTALVIFSQILWEKYLGVTSYLILPSHLKKKYSILIFWIEKLNCEIFFSLVSVITHEKKHHKTTLLIRW